MKNRILGIAALLAAVVLGLAFVSCPMDTEDRELTFINDTNLTITIVTDGSPVTLQLAPVPNLTAPKTQGTVKKTGSDITLKSVSYNNNTVNGDVDAYIIFDVSSTLTGKQPKDGVSLGSGIITFSSKGGAGNPANIPSKISVIPVDE